MKSTVSQLSPVRQLHGLHHHPSQRSYHTFSKPSRPHLLPKLPAGAREDAITLRSEAEAPFRSIRMVLCGVCAASASLGFLISIPQLIGALRHTENALQVQDVFVNIGVDVGAAALFAFLFSRDWEARERQLARLGREETLGALPIQLANGRQTKLGALRSFARCVLVAGTPAQVQAAVAGAQQYREELQRRGVLLIQLPIFEESGTVAAGGEVGGAAEGGGPRNLRWLARGMQPGAWASWFETQLKLSNKGSKDGLYIGLRMDGRVRASGTGQPPWARFAAELAPLEGDDKWTGFFDGFDGRV